MSAVIPPSLPFECTSPRLMNAASPLCQSHPLTVPARDPAAAGNGKEDLAEPCLVVAAELAAEPRERLGLVVAAEHAQGTAELRCVGHRRARRHGVVQPGDASGPLGDCERGLAR